MAKQSEFFASTMDKIRTIGKAAHGASPTSAAAVETIKVIVSN